MVPPIGAQVWALRQEITARPGWVFEKLALTGFNFVEPAGFDLKEKKIQGLNSKEFKNICNKQGLKLFSGHFNFLPHDTKRIIETAHELELKYVVISSLPENFRNNLDSYFKAADAFNSMGSELRSNGIQFVYHNHSFEFEKINGQIPFNILLKNTNPDWVSFQADIGWMISGGYAPVDYFRTNPLRFPLWHLRDVELTTGKTTIAGQGSVKFQEIINERQLAGLQLPIIELASGMENPFEKIITSLHYFKGLDW